MSEGEFIACQIRQLPLEERIPAARTAARENPANAPAPEHAMGLAALGVVPVLTPARLALLTSKYWGAGGVKLSVSFLDGPTASLRAKILAHANAWGTRANVVFSETAGQGQVRVARTAGQGYYSYLGTDILHVPAGQATLNLDSFTDATPESEFFRVVRHEFGHTLGFAHEHPRRQIVALLDPAKTVAYFERTQGWSEADIYAQVLTPLADAEITATPEADVLSVMCYQFPGECTKSGQPIPGGTDIDASDYQLAAKLYPPGVVAPPPPPLPGGSVALFNLMFLAALRKGRTFSFKAPVAVPAGTYAVSPLTAAATATEVRG